MLPDEQRATLKTAKLTMSSRRDFLNFAMKGSALTAAAALMPDGASAARQASQDQTSNTMQNETNSSSQRHHRPAFKFGMNQEELARWNITALDEASIRLVVID